MDDEDIKNMDTPQGKPKKEKYHAAKRRNQNSNILR